MKILIAPNAFKGTLKASEATNLIASLLQNHLPSSEQLIHPVADGGDGTCELLIESLNLEKRTVCSLNAVGQPISGFYGWDKGTKTAYLDVSVFSGLGNLKVYQKDPRITSTYGTGLAIRDALKAGAEEIILGLGGSATIDVGSGILGALGFLFLDDNGREIPIFSPNLMENTCFIQRPLIFPKVKFTCLCDVKNYFFGEKGAVPIFGPQKGLDEKSIDAFESVILNFFQLLKKRSKKEFEDQVGFGAAGGIAMGLDLFFPVKLAYGSSYFFEKINLIKKIEQADWIITGEGRYDSQSKEGKACFEILQLAKERGKKTALITSGAEGYSSDFDLVMELPELDFSKVNYKEKANENLQRLLISAISNGFFV